MKDQNVIEQCEGFQWDTGNSAKNWDKHGVSRKDCEEVFFNHPLLLVPDSAHSKKEQRYYVLGQTDEGHRLFVAFTVRSHLIRVISARDMSRKERGIYETA